MSCCWLIPCVCVVCFQRNLKSYSFIIFAVICLATLIYIWVVIPETKNATFLDISKLFAKRNKVEIVVQDEECTLKELAMKKPETNVMTSFWLWCNFLFGASYNKVFLHRFIRWFLNRTLFDLIICDLDCIDSGWYNEPCSNYKTITASNNVLKGYMCY